MGIKHIDFAKIIDLLTKTQIVVLVTLCADKIKCCAEFYLMKDGLVGKIQASK